MQGNVGLNGTFKARLALYTAKFSTPDGSYQQIINFNRDRRPAEFHQPIQATRRTGDLPASGTHGVNYNRSRFKTRKLANFGLALKCCCSELQHCGIPEHTPKPSADGCNVFYCCTFGKAPSMTRTRPSQEFGRSRRILNQTQGDAAAAAAARTICEMTASRSMPPPPKPCPWHM